jgi:pimeloyl-ACP methyl ester carboxylesterase
MNVVRNMAFRSRLCFALFLLLCAYGDPARGMVATSAGNWIDSSPHKSLYVSVNGVRLNYLDWGGDGPPLILIHGLGDNPHSFDDLARALSPRFRVIAYARRGHGKSEAPSSGYDLATLTEDLKQLLDRLGITQADLLGWCMGGNEITEFAARYPHRVTKLVYLDSGYDWSNPAFVQHLVSYLRGTRPAGPDRASLDAYRAWYRTSWLGQVDWTNGLEAYLRDATRIVYDGGVRSVPGGFMYGTLIRSISSSPRRYLDVHAPALALYATAFLPLGTNPAQAERARTFNAFMTGFQSANRHRLEVELSNVTVRQIGGVTHRSIGVTNIAALADTIQNFLLAGPQHQDQ